MSARALEAAHIVSDDALQAQLHADRAYCLLGIVSTLRNRVITRMVEDGGINIGCGYIEVRYVALVQDGAL